MVDGPGSLGETPVGRLGLEPAPGERGAVGRGGPRDLVAFDHPNLFDEWLRERKKEVQRKDHVDRFFLTRSSIEIFPTSFLLFSLYFNLAPTLLTCKNARAGRAGKNGGEKIGERSRERRRRDRLDRSIERRGEFQKMDNFYFLLCFPFVVLVPRWAQRSPIIRAAMLPSPAPGAPRKYISCPHLRPGGAI